MTAPSSPTTYAATEPDLQASLARRLAEVAGNIAPGSPEGDAPTLRPLHALLQWCQHAFDTAAADGARVPLYLLSALLSDVFENLTGDFPYDEFTDGVRRTFFRALRTHLGELSTEALDSDAWRDVFERVLQDYVRTISELNIYFEKQQRGARTGDMA